MEQNKILEHRNKMEEQHEAEYEQMHELETEVDTKVSDAIRHAEAEINEAEEEVKEVTELLGD